MELYNVLYSCYKCKWECLGDCCLRRDNNGNREPVFDEPVNCKRFEMKEEKE